MRKITFCLMFCALGVFASAEPFAWWASEDVSYDDNIYLTENNEKSSAISSTKLGAEYKANIPESGLNLEAKGYGGYNAYTEDNGKNGFWEGAAEVNLANDVFQIGDGFLFTSDPANSELTERAKRIGNTFYVSAKNSPENKISFGLLMDDVYTHYLESDWESLNRNRVNVGAEVFYNFSSKTNVFFETTYSDIVYSSNTVNNSNGYNFALGAEGNIAPKVRGIAKAVYSVRKYDKDLTVGSVKADNYNDLLGYVVSLDYTPTNRNLIRLSGQRVMEETTFVANRYYVSSLIGLTLMQKLMDKWEASVKVSYENMYYPMSLGAGTDKRNDNMYVVRPALDYKFEKWLSAGVWYQFRKRASNMSAVEYDNNKAGLYVKAIF